MSKSLSKKNSLENAGLLAQAGSVEVNPKSYFEQLEPRIILGSCLALGGAEALLSNAAEAAERDNPAVTAPPAEIQNPKTIKSLPTTEIPTLFSWKPSISDIEAFAKKGLNKKQPAKNWLNQSNGGGGLSDKLKDVPKATGSKYKSQNANGGYKKLASPIQQAQASTAGSLFTGAKTATSPQVTIQSLNPGNYINTGSNAPGSIVVNTGTDSMVLRATGSFTALSGSEYTLSLSASGPGSNTIINWTIDWGDGTVEDIDGNPDQASHVYAEEGAYIIKTSVSDGENTWSSSTVPVQVVNAAQPDFVSSPPTDAGIGQDWQYKAKAVRPDGGQVSYALVSGPQGMTIDANTGLLSWTPGAEYVGQHTIIIEALGEQGKTARQEISLTVHEELQSRPPQIVSGLPSSVPAGADFSFQVEAWDPDGNALSFSLENAPNGMTISQDGLIEWTPSEEMSGQTLKITLKVEDGQGGSVSREFTLVVGEYQPPVIVSTPSQYAVIGKEYSYKLAAENSNGTADNLIYSLEQGPAGMSIDPTTGLITYVASEAGNQMVEVSVSDGQTTESQSFTLQMVVDPPPQFVTTPDKYAVLGQEYQYQAVVMNHIPTLLTTTTDYPISWSLEYPVQGMSISNTGLLTFNPAYAGSVAVTIIARDRNGQEARQDFEILVRDPAVNQAPVVHSQMRENLAVGVNYIHQVIASDPNSDPLTYQLLDGPAGAYLYDDGQFLWSPTTDQLGQHTIAIRVADDMGAWTDIEYTVNVVQDYTNQPPVFTTSPPTLASVSHGWTYRALASDPDNDSVYYVIEQGPAGMTVDHVSGMFRWLPTSDQLGQHEVTVGVIDGYGAWATQTFTITVQAYNTAPVITSTPNTIGQIGSTWIYQATAADGEGDEYTFSLGDSAPMMLQLDSQTGLMAFTSDVAGQFQIDLFVTDANGATSMQSFVLVIQNRVGNLPPQINSNPSFYAAVGKEYSYQIQASDPNGDSLSYSLGTSPDGMTIDCSGRLTWTPSSNFLGEHRVEIIVSDGMVTAMQSYLLRVAHNAAPTFDKIPNQTVTGGMEFVINAAAKDPNQDVLFYEIISGPEGLTIDQSGRVSWRTATANSGETHQVVIRAVDPFGEEAQVSFSVAVLADLVAPEVTLTSSAQPANVNDTVSFYVQASDNIGVAGMSLTINGQAVALDSTGLATFVFTTAGEHTVIATAWDEAGNITEKTLILRVANPSDRTAPTLSWNVTNKAVIKDLFNVTGTATDASGLTWTLSLSHVDADYSQVLASGEQGVQNGLLGTIDPSMWPNGSYILGFEAVDSNGNKSRLAAIITISSQYKMGNFNLTFDDLTINIGGIPVTIQRTYDTLNANVNGDFGYGWSMSYATASLRDDTAWAFDGDDFYGLFSNDVAFRNGTKITVRTPDGKNTVFRVEAYKANMILPYYSLRFINESGNGATLALSANVSLYMDSYGYLTDTARAPFHPASSWTRRDYVLTTVEGTKYSINGQSGECTQVMDANGNKVTISRNGMTSYVGNTVAGTVTFQRDSRGRISSISDANGIQVTYEYDEKGDLVAVNRPNAASGNVNLHYVDDPKAPPHYLKSITDNRGVELIGIQYDFQNGRISGITGPDGSSSSVSFIKVVAPGLNVETVTDPLGRTTESVVDKDGNVVRLIQYIPDVADPSDMSKMSYQITISEYDTKGNCLGTARTFLVTEAQLRAAGKNQYDYVPADLFWQNRSTYDAKNNQLTSTDAYGKVTKYTYDTKSNLLTETDPYGRVISNKYSSNGLLTEKIDVNGSKTNYSYDGRGNITVHKVTNPDGSVETLSFEYNSSGGITKMVDKNGDETRYAFDGQGRQIFAVTEITDPQDPSVVHTVSKFDEYDQAGNIVKSWQEIDGLEVHRWSATYNEVGQTVSTVSEAGLSTEYFYDINGREVEKRQQVVDSQGTIAYLVKRSVYDAGGQLIWEQQEHLETDPVNSPLAAIATYMQYDSLGRVVRAELRSAVLIKMSEVNQFPTTQVTGTGNLIGFDMRGYSESGQEAWTQSSTGVKTINYYTPQGELSHSLVDLDGDLSTVDDQYVSHQNIYDQFGRELQSIMDKDGDLNTTDDQMRVTYEYNALSQLIGMTYSDGSSISYVYNSAGLKTSETDQLGRTTYYEYDDSGRLTAVVLPQVQNPSNGLMVHPRYEYSYNEKGQQTSLRDNIFLSAPLNSGTINRSDQRETVFEYDWNGNQISRTLPDGSTEYFSYDLRNREIKHISFEGRITTREYNSLDQVTRIIHFNNQADFDRQLAVKTIDYAYDFLGQVIREIDSTNGTTTSEYDQEGRVSRIASPQGTVNYEYDRVSGQVSRTWTGTDSANPVTDVRNTYDALGRLAAVSTLARGGAALASPETVNYIYDIIGNLDKLIQANGVIEDYNYDELNRLKELTHYAPDATPEDLTDNVVLQRYEYDYSADGNRTGETLIDAQGRVHTWAWVYDQLGRLIGESHDNSDDSLDYAAEYVYDLVGNRLEKKLDQGNDGTVETVIEGVFDQNDRLQSETEKVNGQAIKRTDYVYRQSEQIAKTVIDLINSRVETRTDLEYNAQGRLSKVTVDTYTNGAKSESVTQEYTYNSSGMKIRQVERTDADADGIFDGQSDTSYLNEALNHTGYAQVLEERTVENGRPVKVTTYTIGHDVLSQFDSVNGYLALLVDGHGSTRAIANANGLVVQQYGYDAYGNAHGFDADQALTRLLYSGEQFNPTTGLQYLRARWYDPTSGRFNRLDPYFGDQGSPLSFHKYAYAHMNPVMGTDPSGLLIERAIVLGIIGVSFSYWALMGSNQMMMNFTTPNVFEAVLAALPYDYDQEYTRLGLNQISKDIRLAMTRAWDRGEIARNSNLKVFPVSQFKYGSVFFNHMLGMVKRGKFVADKLTYLGIVRGWIIAQGYNKNRQEAMKGVPTKSGWDRDEYPYASTIQGGAKSTVSYVDPSENRSHGGSLGWFYTRQLGEMRKSFHVLLVPDGPNPNRSPYAKPFIPHKL